MSSLMAHVQNQNPYRSGDANPRDIHPLTRGQAKRPALRMKMSEALKYME